MIVVVLAATVFTVLFLGCMVTSRGLSSLGLVEQGVLQVVSALHVSGYTQQLRHKAVKALNTYDRLVKDLKLRSRDITVYVVPSPPLLVVATTYTTTVRLFAVRPRRRSYVSKRKPCAVVDGPRPPCAHHPV